MPHIIVKMYSGKTDQQKSTIAEEITKAMAKAANYGADAVSVSIEDVAPNDWVEKVYKPDIVGKPDNLFKKPGYDPL